MSAKISYIDLGRKGYRETWDLQKELLEKMRGEKKLGGVSENYILFVEHPHVYTLGKSGDEANMLINGIQLQAEGAEFIKVDRGGDITYHGPGQLVVYPVIDLEAFHLGVKEYVHMLEEVVITALKTYGIDGDRLDGATGVWLDKDLPLARKVCAIGVKCSGFITMHGFALNANTDMRYFNYINPCGFVDKGVTSMEKELGRKVELEELKEKIRKGFIKELEKSDR